MIGDILQPTHLLFVLIVALLVLGPKRLPEVGRSLGRGLRDFRNAMSGDDSHTETIEPQTGTTPGVTATTAPAPPAASPAEPATTPLDASQTPAEPVHSPSEPVHAPTEPAVTPSEPATGTVEVSSPGRSEQNAA